MSMLRVVFSLSFFLVSLLLGWVLRRRGLLTLERASRLTTFLIKYPAPIVLCSVLWLVHFDTWQLKLLPIVGALVAVSMLLPAWIASRRMKLNRPQTGSMLTCAMFSNLGYIGAFTAFALFGEEGFGLCMLYLLFFSPCFFTLGFSIARRYGHPKDPSVPRPAEPRPSWLGRPGALAPGIPRPPRWWPLQSVGSGGGPALAEDLWVYPFAGMVLGLVLNLLDVPRPAAFSVINAVLIPVDTGLYLVAIGSQVIVRPLRGWLRAGLVMCGIKFLYAPAVALLLVNAMGLEGMPRFIVLLEASTPVGVSPLVLSMLFGLDRQLSSALWRWTTILAIPWLLLVIPLLQRL